MHHTLPNALFVGQYLLALAFRGFTANKPSMFQSFPDLRSYFVCRVDFSIAVRATCFE